LPSKAAARPTPTLSLVACIDANVLISALAFGGKPQLVVDRLLAGDFASVTGENILAEVRRNATSKLKLPPSKVDTFLDDIRDTSSVYVPTGSMSYITHEKDNLVLEVAFMGAVDILVTGDMKHLLPLSPLRGLTIEPPSVFLTRFGGL
jgi:putative PIN family toxin of toxin-antitoxin system